MNLWTTALWLHVVQTGKFSGPQADTWSTCIWLLFSLALRRSRAQCLDSLAPALESFLAVANTRGPLGELIGVLVPFCWPTDTVVLGLNSYSLATSTMAAIVPLHSASRQRGADAHSQSCRHTPPHQHCMESCHSVRTAPLRASETKTQFTGVCTPSVGLGGARQSRKTRTPYDVVGLGEAMVDYSGMVSTECLEQIGIESGGRRCVSPVL